MPHIRPLAIGVCALVMLSTIACTMACAPAFAGATVAPAPAPSVAPSPSPSPSPAPALAALPPVPLPFEPEEFSPGSDAERALLREIAERMAGIPKPGDAANLDDQRMAAWKRYFGEFPAGKFVKHAVGLYAKAVRGTGKVEVLLADAGEMMTKTPSAARSNVAMMLARQYVASKGDVAKVTALLDELAKNPAPELAWQGTLGGAQMLAATGNYAAAAARLEQRGDKDLQPGQLLDRDYWLGRLLHERSLTLKGDERAKTETRVRELLTHVADACEKSPATTSGYAAAFVGLARLALGHADAAAARSAYEKVAKLYPGTAEAQEAMMLAPQVELLGKPAPAFEGKDTAGQPVSSKLLAGKIGLVDFWATTCPPCLRAAPGLAQMAHALKDRPFAIISISLDQPGKKEEIDAFLKKVGIDWPQVYDGNSWQSEMATSYHVTAIPSMFLVDETGKVARVGLEGAELREAVEAELSRLEKSRK